MNKASLTKHSPHDFFRVKRMALLLALFFLVGNSYAQNSTAKLIDQFSKIEILSIEAESETERGLMDGKLIVTFNYDLPKDIYNIDYDFNFAGNHQSLGKRKLEGTVLVIENILPGTYLNLKISGKNLAIQSNDISTFVDHGPAVPLQIKSMPCLNVEWTNCDGSPGAALVLQGNTYYNATNDATPCGFKVNDDCIVVDQNRWQCLNGDKPNPPPLSPYRPSTFQNLGLDALTAARIGYIIQNYQYDVQGVSNAIWWLTSSGGNPNTIYQDAVQNVTQANGLENSIRFLESINDDYQDMIEYNNGASISGLVWNDLNGNGIQNFGEPGIEGVTVSLSGTDETGGTVQLSTLTRSNGTYVFANLDAGTYNASLPVIPSGFILSPSDQGNNDDIDSDFNENTAISNLIGISNNENVENIDAGLFCQSSIALVNLPTDGEFQCGEDPIFDTPDVVDFCGDFTLSFEDERFDNGSCAGLVIIRTWTATDNFGNTTTAQQTLTEIDTEAPVIIGLPDEDVIEFACSEIPEWPEPIATDNCGEVTLTCIIDVGSRRTCIGDGITKTWTAEDECGNITTASLTLIPVDNQAPLIIGVEPDGTYSCGENPNFSQPTVEDECASVTGLIFEDIVAGGNCAGGTITRIWTASDACGNESTASQTFTLVDTIAPIIIGVGQDSSYCIEDGIPAFSMPTAMDNCGLILEFSFEDLTIDSITMRTWTAVDSCGNSSTATQSFTSRDCNSINTFVWDDLNGNGRQDFAEPGIENIEVQLYSAFNNELVRSKFTDQNGTQIFEYLSPGNYYMVFQNPIDKIPTGKSKSRSAKDSDINRDGKSINFSITANEEITHIDAGFTNPSVIGDQVWYDSGSIKNELDAEDEVLQGVQIELYDGDKNILLDHTVSSPTGRYNFLVPPGNYKLKFAKQGFDIVSPNMSNEVRDSDILYSGFTNSISIGYEERNMDIDAGFKDRSAIFVAYEDIAADWNSRSSNTILNWSLNNVAIDPSKFIVERSKGDIYNFTQISTVDQITNLLDYSFIDRTIESNNTYYYRVKHLSSDGKFIYSDIATVEIEWEDLDNEIVHLYPNPTVYKAYVNIQLTEKSDVLVSIHNANGDLIKIAQNKKTLNKGLHRLEIETATMNQGIYFIQAQIGDQRIAKKLMVIE